MKQQIRRILQRTLDDIDAGNSTVSDEDVVKIATFIRDCTRRDIPISKYQAYTYLGVSRSTFDAMVRDGRVPRGRKVAGFKELVWFRRDLDRL